MSARAAVVKNAVVVPIDQPPTIWKILALAAKAATERDGVDAVMQHFAEIGKRFGMAALLAVLRPWARREVQHVRRSAAHRVEIAVHHDLGTAETAEDRITARERLNDIGFHLPDGRFVEWTSATASEHRERADWYRDNAKRLQAVAKWHEAAAREIEAAGVTCLAEIGGRRVRALRKAGERSGALKAGSVQ